MGVEIGNRHGFVGNLDKLDLIPTSGLSTKFYTSGSDVQKVTSHIGTSHAICFAPRLPSAGLHGTAPKTFSLRGISNFIYIGIQ